MNKVKRFAIPLFLAMAIFLFQSAVFAAPDCWNCAVPVNLTATNVTNTSIDISWTPGSSCGNFEIWVTDNNNNTWNTYQTTGTSFQLTNLSPLTPYTICVAMISTDQVSCEPACIDIWTPGEGIGCEDCDPPHAITITPITNTSATVNWFPANPACKDFYVYLENLVTGTFQKFVAINTTSYNLTNLTPGTPYKVFVAVISTQQVDCIGTEAEFQTTHDGLPCYDCDPPISVSVSQISSTSAYVSWVPSSNCSEFEVYVMSANSWQMFTTTNTFYQLNNLIPSTAYTVFIANKNYIWPPVSCQGTATDFTTLHCANFNQSFSFYTNRIYFAETQSNVLVDIKYSVFLNGPNQSPTPAASYMMANGSYTLAKNTSHEFAWDDCQFPNTPAGTKYISVWLDYDNSGTFDSWELVTYHSRNFVSNPTSSYNCLSQIVLNNPPNFACNPCSFTTPNQTLSNVRGRCIISLGQAPGPCNTFNDGQVLDFVVNIQ